MHVLEILQMARFTRVCGINKCFCLQLKNELRICRVRRPVDFYTDVIFTGTSTNRAPPAIYLTCGRNAFGQDCANIYYLSASIRIISKFPHEEMASFPPSLIIWQKLALGTSLLRSVSPNTGRGNSNSYAGFPIIPASAYFIQSVRLLCVNPR